MNLSEGKSITCIIIRNKLNESEYSDENFRKDEFLLLSLRNSIIKNSQQHFFSHSDNRLHIPYTLGINYSTEANKWVKDSRDLLMENCKLSNESILNNIIKEFNIDHYQSIGKNFKLNEHSGFSYEK
jgi:hypothetical protein